MHTQKGGTELHNWLISMVFYAYKMYIYYMYKQITHNTVQHQTVCSVISQKRETRPDFHLVKCDKGVLCRPG